MQYVTHPLANRHVNRTFSRLNITEKEAIFQILLYYKILGSGGRNKYPEIVSINSSLQYAHPHPKENKQPAENAE